MQSRLKLKPGQKGTRRLAELCGSRLVCAPYRYDVGQQKRFKMVEIVIEVISWSLKPKPANENTIADLRIAWARTGLGQEVKAAGSKWNRAKRLWRILMTKPSRLA